MDVSQEIESCQRMIKRLVERMAWLEKNRDRLRPLPEATMFGDGLDFNRLTHAETIKIIRTLGGKWSKNVNSADPHKVDYSAQIDGRQIRVWAGEPPPSCRIVEVEELIPAQPARVVKVKKLVCVGHSEPVVDETLKAQNHANSTTTPSQAA